MRRVWAWIVSGAYVALAGACSADHCHDGDSAAEDQAAQQASCANYIERLGSCEVITGTRAPACKDDDFMLPCIWHCMQQANCTQLRNAYGNNAFNGYAGCLNECHELVPPYVCADGSHIDGLLECDGKADCPNGEDEDYCTQGFFDCADGSQIPASWQCDGLTQCDGGEDEAGCPPRPMFVCDDGTSIGALAECDGVENCADGSDELDCAILACE